jgi:hypothetical protein
MRNNKNLKSDKHKWLCQLFPDLLNLTYGEESTKYKKLAISVFDHWLSRTEAEIFLSNVSKEEQHKRDKLFRNFNQLLLEKADLYSFHFIGKKYDILRFSKFVSNQKALNFLMPKGLRGSSLNHFKLVLPEMKAVYFESYDDTNILYYQDKSLIEELIAWVGETGLKVIE